VKAGKAVLHIYDWARATNNISSYGTRPPWGKEDSVWQAIGPPETPA